MTFNDFWAVCPPGRKIDKPTCMALFNGITGGGIETTSVDPDGNRHKLHLQATPQELVEAMKASRWQWNEQDTALCFIPHPRTWLNKGRFMDLEDDERREMAARWDRVQEIMTDRKVVNLR